MRRIAFLLIIFAFISCNRNVQSDFEKHFIDKTLRFNLIHSGDTAGESYTLKKIYDDGLWSGRTLNMVNPYRLGAYYFELKDAETDELLYSESISTYFSEWMMTDEARQKKRSFNESIRIPYPKTNSTLTMYKIDSLNVTIPIWEYEINRQTRALIEPTKNHNNRMIRLLDNGDPKEKVDIVILGDGYTLKEINKFDKDASHFYNILFETEPFKSRKGDFNVHAIQVPPKNNGLLMADYSTFGHDKYALISNEWVFREYATQSPYDFAVILINDENGVGGSLYNNYTTTAVRTQSEDYVIRHEIGHQIVGLADRFYYDDEVPDSTSTSSYFDDFNDLINNILNLHTK